MMETMKKFRDLIIEEINVAVAALDLNELQTAVKEIIDADHVFCDGLGRSGLVVSGFAMRLGQMGKESALVGEATAPAFEKGDLLLLCTASGSSPTLLHHAEQAKAYGGKVILITGRGDSPVAGLADALILVHAPDKDLSGRQQGSIQPMGSLFEQTAQLICDIMSVKLMEELELTSEEMRRRHANIE